MKTSDLISTILKNFEPCGNRDFVYIKSFIYKDITVRPKCHSGSWIKFRGINGRGPGICFYKGGCEKQCSHDSIIIKIGERLK